ncbi:NAD(P)-dependent oxidoreductase [Solimonas fluminis]|uniref:NAD(P)-dependent oxidoreductase n=1 Tax=Solimonas fluminis TaxID=2086571 RepID=A0A2S5TH53_9GAMM|nr:SDR family oxidoreductase [Solimonas fluminis]PPE74310.1 NAD(P)-dependent oxidoreductase [Solimonas fluminis]
MTNPETIAVTGASGQLGRLVLAGLRRRAPAARLIGLLRNPAAAPDLAAQGVELRPANYDDPASLEAALAGAGKLLLISSSEIGRRLPQHRNVIDAAKAAGVKLLAYTSILHADSSPMALAAEHRATEEVLRASGLPVVLLRNGWYTENYSGHIAAALQHGAVLGAARDGRISAAARADYAEAAAAVLAAGTPRHAGKTYELAGDEAFTLSQYAAEIAGQSGRTVVYQDLGEAGYQAALQGTGLPPDFAALLAESDARAAAGSLYDASQTLSRLIGRPTTTLAASVAAALAALRGADAPQAAAA